MANCVLLIERNNGVHNIIVYMYSRHLAMQISPICGEKKVYTRGDMPLLIQNMEEIFQKKLESIEKIWVDMPTNCSL